MKILMVDDSATVRAMLAKALKISGHRGSVFQASNGKEALEVMKERGADLIFADIRMPEMDGLDMIREMRRDQALKAAPVIAMSAEPEAVLKKRLAAQHVRAYLRKPFTPEQVSALLRAITGGANG